MPDDSFRVLQYVTVTPITKDGVGDPVVSYHDQAEAMKVFHKAVSAAIKENKTTLITLRNEKHEIITSEFVKEALNSSPKKTSSPLKPTPGWKSRVR
jgi:hypothetical protein